MRRKSKKYIFRYLEKHIVNANDCKYLHGKSSRKYFLYFRDRTADTTYYLINIKGNSIKAYAIQYKDGDGQSLNLFFRSVLAIGENAVAPITIEKVVTVKERLQNYLTFIYTFKHLTPNLNWYE